MTDRDRIGLVDLRHDTLDPGPLPRPFEDATMGPFTHWKLSWLTLVADDGTEGHAPGGIHPLMEAPLREEGPRTVGEWWHRLWWLLRNAGHRNPAVTGAMASVDLAMRDILAKRAGVPLHRHLGAERDAVPVYASGGGTNLSRDELANEMRGYADAGHTTLKMKVAANFAADLAEDAARVRAVREAVGDEVALAVDANQACDAERALELARRLAPYDIAWLEEPVDAADRRAIAELARRSPIPIACGESEDHWLGFRDLAECGVSVLQPVAQRLPGFARWSEAACFAEEAGAALQSGALTPIAATFLATRAAGTAECLFPVVGHWLACFLGHYRLEAGKLVLPAETPGLALEPDPALLGSHAGSESE